MSNEETRDSVEFIAFLLWYSFLVFCCVLPTCCAYRRRQMLMQLQREEAEFEQRYFFGGGQFGVAGGSNDANHHGSNGMDDEEARAERTRRITAVLKATSFVVEEKDILLQNKEECSGEENAVNLPVGDGKEKNESSPSATIQVDEELGAVVDVDMMDPNVVLQLPTDGENASRLVPGGCAICLDTYRVGDEVIWSPEASCPHAFHRDCIIPWLAKKEEPKCPCCRQTFCEVEPVRTEASSSSANAPGHLHPFGLIPSGFIMRQNISQNGRELIIIPSANLIVSQTVDDRGMMSLRISERDPPASGNTDDRNTEEQTEEAVHENSSEVESANGGSASQTDEMAIAQVSSEIEMEAIRERSPADEGAPRSEQSASYVVNRSSETGEKH